MNHLVSHLPKRVSLFEVGPRDGLQNEKAAITVADKVKLINQLSQTGLTRIEAGSFVSPKWVPQMANSSQVFAAINRKNGTVYSALTPNGKGLQAALAAKVDEIAVFGAASETFSRKNINCSISESLERFAPVIKLATEHGLRVRGYVSCVMGCPYEGHIDVKSVANVSEQLVKLGCYEISLGDTIGCGTPEQVKRVVNEVSERVAIEALAIHCHDTYGQAIANIYAALQCGISTIDSSVAGLGGCPYAAGASGNVASEDVVYLLQGLGIECGVNLAGLIDAGNTISRTLGRQNQSKVARAMNKQ